jgi:hypothetical protein
MTHEIGKREKIFAAMRSPARSAVMPLALA